MGGKEDEVCQILLGFLSLICQVIDIFILYNFSEKFQLFSSQIMYYYIKSLE